MDQQRRLTYKSRITQKRPILTLPSLNLLLARLSLEICSLHPSTHVQASYHPSLASLEAQIVNLGPFSPPPATLALDPLDHHPLVLEALQDHLHPY